MLKVPNYVLTLSSDNPDLSKLLTASYLGGVSIVNSEVGMSCALVWANLEYDYERTLIALFLII